MIGSREVLDGRGKIEIARRDQGVGAGAKVRAGAGAEAGVEAETGGEGGLHQDPDEDMMVGAARDGLGPGVPAPADQMMTNIRGLCGHVAEDRVVDRAVDKVEDRAEDSGGVAVEEAGAITLTTGSGIQITNPSPVCTTQGIHIQGSLPEVFGTRVRRMMTGDLGVLAEMMPTVK